MLDLLPARVTVRETPDGLVLASPAPLPAPARAIGDWLAHWAQHRATTTFLAERVGASWRSTTYADALAAVEGIASHLLASGADPAHPVAILSDNSVANALLALGAMHAGIPVAPVSPAYSLQSKSFARLGEVLEQLDPGFVFADDEARFAAALAHVPPHVQRLTPATLGERTPRSDEAAAAFAKITPQTIAKVLFTSGSTGRPKGIVNPHGMLTANQESLAACWPFLATRPPIVVDWLPWSHTFGGNHNFNLVLRNGGSLYIDRGRPAPGLVEVTVQNLADVQPNLWFNVPRGFDQAVALLEREPALARRAFANLDLIFYAAAALAPTTRERLEQVAAAAGRPEIFFTSAWGSTETAPLATSAHFATHTTGILGLPVPGVELKLAPVQDRLELRVRGPSVTPGHWQRGGGIAPLALDADGFVPTGDAGRFADPHDPSKGVVFGGRLGENFKLASGTWVGVAQVRLALVDACAPLLLDAVITGHDRDALGALLFVAPAADRERLRAALHAYNAQHPGSSERIACAMIMTEPLSLDDGESTDKGYTNQRRVLERRAAHVEDLYNQNADSANLLLV